MARPKSHAGELVGGYFGGFASIVTGTSIGVFIVTAVMWYLADTKHLPGSVWPWTLSLAFFLLALASVLVAMGFMSQRDGAEANLKKHLDVIRFAFDFVGAFTSELKIDKNARNVVRPFQFSLIFQNVLRDEPIAYRIHQATFWVGNRQSDPIDPPVGPAILAPGQNRGYLCGRLAGISVSDLKNPVVRAEYVIRYGHPLKPRLDNETRHAFRLDVIERDAEGLPFKWQWVSTSPATFEPVE